MVKQFSAPPTRMLDDWLVLITLSILTSWIFLQNKEIVARHHLDIVMTCHNSTDWRSLGTDYAVTEYSALPSRAEMGAQVLRAKLSLNQ